MIFPSAPPTLSKTFFPYLRWHSAILLASSGQDNNPGASDAIFGVWEKAQAEPKLIVGYLEVREEAEITKARITISMSWEAHWDARVV
jgi:hypothetical protein